MINAHKKDDCMKRNFVFKKIFVFHFLLLLLSPAVAFSADSYKFERMWPMLKQPWYFYGVSAVAADQQGNFYAASQNIYKFTSDGLLVNVFSNFTIYPTGITVDKDGYVYVIDAANHRIQKFSPDGAFVTQWGTQGAGPGQFDFAQNWPSGITVSSNGDVYVSDSADRIQKFTSDGTFALQWGSYGSGEGQFDNPEDVAVDSYGYVYVADSPIQAASRIQKFSPDGTFIQQWGAEGQLMGITVDANNFIYVASRGGPSFVQKFTSDGVFVTKWGGEGSGVGGQFTWDGPWGIDEGGDGSIYVIDHGTSNIQKFTTDGIWLGEFKSFSFGKGEFNAPYDIDRDEQGNIYVADTYNNRIQKFSADGTYKSKWGSSLTVDQSFVIPHGIVFDDSGHVYVVEPSSIRKFNTDGTFIKKWGTWGGGDGQLGNAQGVAIDSQGLLYVADNENNRIQKFSADGTFVTKWGTAGSGDGQFNHPWDVAIDSQGFVYVIDNSNHRIQKFTLEGAFIKAWGIYGTNDGQLNSPTGIAVDAAGFIYVADNGNNRVQKFTSDGVFVYKWGSKGSGDGQFNSPYGIAIEEPNYVYVTDANNYRIQKFSKDGAFIGKWGSNGTGFGQFIYKPDHIAINTQGQIFVSEINRIQIFNSDGTFITKWYYTGTGDGEFNGTFGVGVGPDGNVYVADYFNNRIQKFTSEGTFIKSWPVTSPRDVAVSQNNFVYAIRNYNNRDEIVKYSTDGALVGAMGPLTFGVKVAIDHQGFVYVVDRDAVRVKKYDSDLLGLRMSWGTAGSAAGQLNAPWGIGIDEEGYVWVGDSGNSRIQKFTAEGQFVSKLGERGTGAGNFALSSPRALVFDSQGWLYALDTNNNRIEVFSPWVSGGEVTKAVIVAGGGPFPGNTLWDSTQVSANFAYRSLAYQGFTKESIYYLSSDLSLDLDANGVADEVDAPPTNASIEYALTEWAADADHVVVYLVDHGSDGKFRLSQNEELRASDVDQWLDTLQASLPGKVIVVYDACRSGSFLPVLTPPEDKERIVIASASATEDAYFVSQGSISFSSYFWNHVYDGLSVQTAYDLASQAITYTTNLQHPQLDDNGDGLSDGSDGTLAANTYIGNGTQSQGEAPVITSVSDPQTINNTSTAQLQAAGVTDSDGIGRVWAVIRPPNYHQDISGAVQSLPMIDLLSVDGQPGKYQNSYEYFNIAGTYQIAVYAKDRMGNPCVPKLTTVTVTNPLRRHAIIVAGGSTGDSLWPAIQSNAQRAYDALKFQGYSDADIYYMSAAGTTGVDCSPTLEFLEDYLELLSTSNTQDLVLYLIGNGNTGTFQINGTEILTASQLKSWLDSLQATIPGKVSIIYDACKAGSFVSQLTPPADKQRIIITSTGSNQSASFLSGGNISFSKYFWGKVFNGANLKDAFDNTKAAMALLGQLGIINTTPQLDDNGNGVANEGGKDGRVARYYTPGVGIMIAGVEPTVTAVVPEQAIGEAASAGIWAEVLAGSSAISRVWAVIKPPDYSAPDPSQPVTELPTIDLTSTGNNRYEGLYSNFTQQGIYNIAVYALDVEGNVSLPLQTSVTQEQVITTTTTSVPPATTTTTTIPPTTTTSIEPDTDGDGMPDSTDNCPNKPNGPALGTCSASSDKPGITCTDNSNCANGCSSNGNCIKTQSDADGDGVGDVCDNCPNNCNTGQSDADGDQVGDVCDDPNNDGCGGCGQPVCEQQC